MTVTLGWTKDAIAFVAASAFLLTLCLSKMPTPDALMPLLAALIVVDGTFTFFPHLHQLTIGTATA